MITPEIEELYRHVIQPLPVRERLALLACLAGELAELDSDVERAVPKRSLLELEGLGAEIWTGADAQEYVDALRDEWDHGS